MAVERTQNETSGHGSADVGLSEHGAAELGGGGHGGGGHGHLKLEYQPGLPLANSKLIVWLFLSTEIMFFSALIGTFIVIRFVRRFGRKSMKSI